MSPLVLWHREIALTEPRDVAEAVLVDTTTALVTLVSVALGAAITGTSGFAVDSMRYRRKRNDQLRDYRLDRIRQTGRMLQAVVDQGRAAALGDLVGSKAAQERAQAQEEASLYLVGDDAVALAYRDLLISVANHLGKAFSVEEQMTSLEVMNRVAKALGDQEELARSGKPLRQLSSVTIEQLSDVRSMADQMPFVDIQPTVDARLARLVLSLKRRSSGRQKDRS